MAIRWEDIQNLSVTESEVNLLAGLAATAAELNSLSGFTGDTTDLNSVVGLEANFNTHVAENFATAHPISANSLDGLIMADGTIPESKLAFNTATQIELDALQTEHDGLQTDHMSLQAQVDALAAVVIPGQGAGIADSIAQTIAHIDNVTDAHDATAISYGETESGYYLLPTNVTNGDTTIQLNASLMRFFRRADSITMASNVAPEATYSISDLDEDSFTITISPAAASDYLVANGGKIWNLEEVNAQQGIDRGLKSKTDTLDGRLTVSNADIIDAVVINKSNAGFDINFVNQANISSGSGYNLDLGSGANRFDIDDEFGVSIFGVDNFGNAHANTSTLRDYTAGFDGRITKETLTASRTWTFPDRDGWIAIGDLTFADLLRVSVDSATGIIEVAAGVKDNVIGEKTRAWINMAQGSDFAGGSTTALAQLTSDGELTGMASDYKAFIVYLTYNDDLFFWYSTAEPTEQDAINNLPPYLPTAYMKLALLTIRGDGSGGIDNSTLKIHEDLRPLLGQGMSNAHYDESVHFGVPLLSGNPVILPNNSRAGNKTQGYTVGSGELEVYVNDMFKEPGRDYLEISGNAPGQVVFNYDLPINSVVRLRMSWGAATAISGGGSGGGGGGTLQDAYLAGPNIFTIPGTSISFSGSLGYTLDVSGDMNLAGMLDGLEGAELTSQTAEPGSAGSTSNKLYSDGAGDLIYKKYDTTPDYYNITAGIDTASKQSYNIYTNNTGATIPGMTPVALHPTLAGHIILADVSANIPESRIIGITEANIATGADGKVVFGGVIPNGGSGWAHRDVLYADPTAPGAVQKQSLLALTTGNVAVSLGDVDGSDFLVRIDREGIV